MKTTVSVPLGQAASDEEMQRWAKALADAEFKVQVKLLVLVAPFLLGLILFIGLMVRLGIFPE